MRQTTPATFAGVRAGGKARLTGQDSERFRGSGLTSGIDGVIIDTSEHGFCLVRAEPSERTSPAAAGNGGWRSRVDAGGVPAAPASCVSADQQDQPERQQRRSKASRVGLVPGRKAPSE